MYESKYGTNKPSWVSVSQVYVLYPCNYDNKMIFDFDFDFDLHPNKRLSKQWRGWWFQTLSSPLWRHCNVYDCPSANEVTLTDTVEWITWNRSWYSFVHSQLICCCLGYMTVISNVWISNTTGHLIMMTSANGNIFRVTGPLRGEFTGHWWIPLTKASDAELWCFLLSASE